MLTNYFENTRLPELRVGTELLEGKRARIFAIDHAANRLDRQRQSGLPRHLGHEGTDADVHFDGGSEHDGQELRASELQPVAQPGNRAGGEHLASPHALKQWFGVRDQLIELLAPEPIPELNVDEAEVV